MGASLVWTNESNLLCTVEEHQKKAGDVPKCKGPGCQRQAALAALAAGAAGAVEHSAASRRIPRPTAHTVLLLHPGHERGPGCTQAMSSTGLDLDLAPSPAAPGISPCSAEACRHHSHKPVATLPP